MAFIIPTQARYTNDAGQAVYWIDGAAKGTRIASDIEHLFIHHTGGVDSRKYLWRNELNSSSTYLVGAYEDTGWVPRVYKYMSETTDAPYTQGFGSIAEDDTPREINASGISIEVEGGINQGNGLLFRDGVMEETAKLSASIIRYWESKGIELLLIGHKHVDPRKNDPKWNWNRFCKLTYGYL